MDSEAQIEAELECMSCWGDHRAWQSRAQGGTHAVPIEDIGQLIGSQLHVRPQLRPRPAYSHLTRGDRLELKVPAAALHCIGFLCPEDAHPVPTRLALHLTYKWGQAESEAECRVDLKTLEGLLGETREAKCLGSWGKSDNFLVLEKSWCVRER